MYALLGYFLVGGLHIKKKNIFVIKLIESHCDCTQYVAIVLYSVGVNLRGWGGALAPLG